LTRFRLHPAFAPEFLDFPPLQNLGGERLIFLLPAEPETPSCRCGRRQGLPQGKQLDKGLFQRALLRASSAASSTLTAAMSRPMRPGALSARSGPEPCPRPSARRAAAEPSRASILAWRRRCPVPPDGAVLKLSKLLSEALGLAESSDTCFFLGVQFARQVRTPSSSSRFWLWAVSIS
jgi:hypothetical protein